MPTFKIEKDKNYTVMSNYHLRDKRLSLKAKGLLSFMLSLPEDWDYSLNGLVAMHKEGREAIQNALDELLSDKNKNLWSSAIYGYYSSSGEITEWKQRNREWFDIKSSSRFYISRLC